jgi:hypothetical protein
VSEQQAISIKQILKSSSSSLCCQTPSRMVMLCAPRLLLRQQQGTVTHKEGMMQQLSVQGPIGDCIPADTGTSRHLFYAVESTQFIKDISAKYKI